ncbi:1,4-alpha-glucan branching enzyme [Acetitomaculum ruminis DSM 5522]|uniref:1,4-alpha-glucan branching enzyme GlgB n=1 Tax=Acetitomaculum ruminis DSM 5522 TaxID=1120918 RepID=A0A1I0YA54_9FIRM|nr:1,4-alpha-glucan branching protein GlgB [Acetitomaculum ruminis]SFB09400.1 1,4-alpha-glucan branching enzyme [Acetitomaculum ruminis DSM 5522]
MQKWDSDNFIGELDMYLYGQGTHYEIYKKMGSHVVEKNGVIGTFFDVWAPHARCVHVIGDFNGWDEHASPMNFLNGNGIYELFIPGVKEGAVYKYCITTKNGKKLYKADPYANFSQVRPETASIVYDVDDIKWKDDKWMTKRSEKDIFKSPVAIYEAHIGSWKKHPRGEDGFYSYKEFAKNITPYLRNMGFTHIELMGISEYPFDGSWGYQVTGYYAPTSRYGSPEDFAYMVNYFHKHNIGVILDWVPAHFPKDAHGLADFDGEALYEYPNPKKGEHPDWGTKIFNYAKNEVVNYLIGSALNWVERYHIDGLRVDAVASMLYLDYGKKSGQWIANEYGGNENLEAINFFKHMNSLIRGRNPGIMMIAEESTAWPMVTGDVKKGGLYFNLKWNMGWMHDFLDYMKQDPLFRKGCHNKMTFAMSYNYSENYILVLSHDEVVHLKCSMINKMPGCIEDKFKNLMVGYAFMITHPGKKLLFMGQEFGQLREWSEKRELDWYLLAEESHQRLQLFFKDLLYIYNKYPALYELDFYREGFEWINADDAYRSIFSYVRHSSKKRNSILVVCNFTPIARDDYRVGVPKKKKYTLIFNSDEEEYGGSGTKRDLVYESEEKECDGRPFSFAYKLPAFGVAIFKF